MMHEIDEKILILATKGDKMAFRSIVLHYGKAVNVLAFRFVANKACAEDVTQDTFIKAYKAIAKYQSQAKFSTWLFRITSNTAIDYLRKNKKQRDVDSLDQPSEFNDIKSDHITPDDQLDIGLQLNNAMSDLSDMERLAFTLKHQQGYSIAETAKQLNINNNACKQTIYRAVQKLRLKLNPMVNA